MGGFYRPAPIDTSDVELEPSLLELRELLAENVHELWSRQRLQEGWRYGKARDERAKEHPSLVQYSELPESEKVYDRQTAMETIKTIIKLGFKISKQ